MKITKLFALCLLTVLIVSGCSFGEKEPEQDPSELVQDGLSNLTDVKSANYEMDLGMNISSPSQELGFSEIDFNLNMTGGYDNSDRANPEFSLVLGGNGSLDDGAEQSVKGEMRLTDSKAYFMLSDVSDFDGQVPKEFVAPFLSQWWFIEMPPEFQEIFQAYAGASEEDMTQQEKALKQLFEDTPLFKNVEFDGSEKVAGVDSYKYDVSLDKEALTEYAAESLKISTGEEFTQAERDDMAATWQMIDFTGAVWIGKNDMTLRKISGNFSIDDLDGLNMTFDVTYTLSNLNEDISVEAPAGANDLGAFFGAAMGLDGDVGELVY